MPSNYPPGVKTSDIPGNRPEDIEWENLLDYLAELALDPIVLMDRIFGDADEWANEWDGVTWDDLWGRLDTCGKEPEDIRVAARTPVRAPKSPTGWR